MSRFSLKIFTVFLALMTFTALFADSPSYDENLPESWYTLPEDGGSRVIPQAYTDLTEKQKQGIDRVLGAHVMAFDDFEARRMNRERGEWRLEACITDLSLSVSGIVGALVAKGDASVALYWRRAQTRNVETTDSLNEPIDAEFSTDDNLDDLENRLEPLVQAIMATRHVKNEPALRKNLLEKVFSSHEIIQYLARVPQANWKVSKLRLDLSIDVSGKVNPVTTVGGGVKIRLDWMVKARNRIQQASTSENRKIGDGLKKIAEDLVQVLHTAKFDDLDQPYMALKEIKLGLGIFGEGNVGVVKLGGSLFGYLYLVPNRGFDSREVKFERAVVNVPIIDYTNTAQWQTWATENQIPYNVYETRDGEKAVVYSALADRFKAGLEKSHAMGTRFVERAKQKHGRWEVYQLKTEFSLSLSGDLKIFKLGGTGTIELVFG